MPSPNKRRKGGRSVIVKDLMAAGLTARRAEKALTAVFYCMKRCLWRGEVVPVPGGTIRTADRKGTPRRELRRLSNIQTGDDKYRFVHYRGRRKVVKFTPDLDLDLTPVPPPETAEQAEARQLASHLLGRAADQAIMARLQRATEVHPSKPGALLRRLRDIKSRGYQFADIDSLAHQVTAHYWL